MITGVFVGIIKFHNRSQDNSIVGIGSGSTVVHAVHRLGNENICRPFFLQIAFLIYWFLKQKRKSISEHLKCMKNTFSSWRRRIRRWRCGNFSAVFKLGFSTRNNWQLCKFIEERFPVKISAETIKIISCTTASLPTNIYHVLPYRRKHFALRFSNQLLR